MEFSAPNTSGMDIEEANTAIETWWRNHTDPNEQERTMLCTSYLEESLKLHQDILQTRETLLGNDVRTAASLFTVGFLLQKLDRPMDAMYVIKSLLCSRRILMIVARTSRKARKCTGVSARAFCRAGQGRRGAYTRPDSQENYILWGMKRLVCGNGRLALSQSCYESSPRRSTTVLISKAHSLANLSLAMVDPPRKLFLPLKRTPAKALRDP